MQNNLISQNAQMETNGTPNDLVGAMNQVGCIIFAPLIQEVLYPFLHRRRIYLRPVTRITIGFCFVASTMLYATLVQHFIYSSGDVKINVWVVAPLYFLLAIGEVFAVVTAMEYAYDHSPKDMKAVVQAVSLLIAGVGSAVAMALTPAAHDPLMVIFYGSLTGAMVLTTIIFYIIFRHYDGHTMNDEEEPAVRPPSQVQVGADINEGAVGVFPQEYTASGATPVDEKKSAGVEIKSIV